MGLMDTLLPPEDASNKKLERWRLIMAVSAIAQWLSLGALLAVVNGTVPGFDGYVKFSQLSNLEQLVRETREDQLVAEIIDHTRRYCLAYEAGDTSGMSFAFQALQAARTKYFRLTKREYAQLMCSMSSQPARPSE